MKTITIMTSQQGKRLMKVALISMFILLIASVQFTCYAGNKGALFVKKIYRSEVQAELDQMTTTNEVFTEKDIASLPEPVQRYFRFAGLIGYPKMANAKLRFTDVDFVQGDKEIKLDSEQYNFVSEPARIVYLKSTMFGFIPFEGRDKYLDGEGVMTGKVMKFFTVFDETGPEMNQSALVTFLAEALIVPTCALQDYIQWEEIDSNRAKATMEYAGVKASGIFIFDDRGAFVEFYTDDRYYADQETKVNRNERWTVTASDYVEKDGLQIPRRLRGIWNLDEGDLVYFDGILETLEYDVH